MERGSGGTGRGLYYLLGLLVVLQIAAIGASIHFAGESLTRERALLDRSAIMMEDIFPAMKNELSDVSRRASEIRDDLSGLRAQVSRVDDRGDEIARGVSNLNRQVGVLDKGISGLFSAGNGLVWGNALNPYALMAFLVLIVCSVPVWLWLFSRRNRPPCPEKPERLAAPCGGFTDKLDRLAGLVGRALAAEANSTLREPELRRLMEETEKLIEEARTELAWLTDTTPRCAETEEKPPEMLN